MDPELRAALGEFLLARADDELILAHRNSEWTGHAPILEEDIAFSNIAQDELGHAALWYGLLQGLTGDDPDTMTFFRDSAAFRNLQMVELPNGDWAFSMLRQYLFDAAEMTVLPTLLESDYRPIVDAAAKIRQEEIYHLRHTSSWVTRLGLGTSESHRRMQDALDALWPFALQMFVPLPGEALLADAGFLVEGSAATRERWLAGIKSHLKDAGLSIPEQKKPCAESRADHTEHLTSLLAEMQVVARLDAEAKW
jgi:ring-1,2-phenylacetyl-CoA epoxidase subunit PaaC